MGARVVEHGSTVVDESKGGARVQTFHRRLANIVQNAEGLNGTVAGHAQLRRANTSELINVGFQLII
jgi:hypothetical protein